MKKSITMVAIFLLLLSGCSGSSDEMEQGLALRTRLLSSSSVSFQVEITADYGDKLHIFTLDCTGSNDGSLEFSVVAPQSIAGIHGRIAGEKGALHFDDTALYFPLLADRQLSPVAAPWVLLNTLRQGCITSAGADGALTRLSIDDRFDEDALHFDIWLEESGCPVKAEALFRERKILSLDVKNFTLQ